MRALIAAGLLIWAAGKSGAQIYEWYDEDGQRHFSDQEPVGVAFRVIGIGDESRLSTYTPDRIERGQTPDARQPGRPQGREARADDTAAAELAETCTEYLERLEAVQDQLRAGYSEPRGNRLRARRQALQTAYRRDCT